MKFAHAAYAGDEQPSASIEKYFKLFLCVSNAKWPRSWSQSILHALNLITDWFATCEQLKWILLDLNNLSSFAHIVLVDMDAVYNALEDILQRKCMQMLVSLYPNVHVMSLSIKALNTIFKVAQIISKVLNTRHTYRLSFNLKISATLHSSN